MGRAGKVNLLIVFLMIIFTLPLLTKLQPNASVSQIENRSLAQPPVYTAEALLSGEYFRAWEVFLSDHFYARDRWIKAYTYTNLYGLGKPLINNIVIGRDGFLLPFHSYKTRYDRESYAAAMEKMTGQIARLAGTVEDYGGRFYFVGIPEQSSFHRDKYPAYFQNNGERLSDGENLLFSGLDAQGVSYLNLRTVFTGAGEEYYYRTDHHFNFLGAYTTYYAIMARLQADGRTGEPPLAKEDIDFVNLPTFFAGTRNRQLYYLYPTREKLQIGYPQPEVAYTKISNWLPDPEFYARPEDATAWVSYGVYMGGDKAETVIRTHRPNRPNLLLFGDSFTNAVEPLLYYHFNETRILDLRHYQGLDLDAYIREHRPDVVLMLRDDLNYGNLEGNGNFGGE